MKKNSTLSCMVILTITLCFSKPLVVFSQCVAPSMQFINPVIVSGVDGNINTRYKFPSVVSGVDAIVTITNIVGGATLTSIDDNTFGYSDAWQPVVKTPLTMGAIESYVSFKMEFIKSVNNTEHTFICFTMSAIDIDGDNQHVREMFAANDFTSYGVSNVTTLALNNNAGLLKAVSTILNFPGIDTSAYISNINYRYISKSKINNIRIGSVTDPTFTPQNRYSCIYFRPIYIQNVIVLPSQFLTLNATSLNDNNVKLLWQTNEETTNQSFVIERSSDGINFLPVSLNIELLNKENIKAYQAVDYSNLLNGNFNYYYRVQQIDKSGKVTFSNLSYIHLKENQAVKMEAYPNPFLEKININLKASLKGNIEIRISSITGLTLISKKTNIQYNELLFIDKLNTLPAGVYLVRLIMNNQIISTKKIIKQ